MQKRIKQALDREPLLQRMAFGQPVVWQNLHKLPAAEGIARSGFSAQDAKDALDRLERFAPYFTRVFPETANDRGVIESALIPIPGMRKALTGYWTGLAPARSTLPETILLKMDSHLPVSGSIKARGGFYEVIRHAEALALEQGLLDKGESLVALDSDKARRFFSGYSLAVGSTGNLGLSVGLMGATLGFRTSVYMSRDARRWKKELLRARGVTVVEAQSDYEAAVAAGRAQANEDPHCYFVDDEHSRHLFLGYTAGGLRLKEQLEALGMYISMERPLIVYLPCGVGGGPGGVTFGLKLAFGDAVACYFAEPTESPAVLPGLISGLGSNISAADLGLSGKTAADGLAVGRPSQLVCEAMYRLLDGGFTVPDEDLFALLRLIEKSEGIRLEPSALAGFPGLRYAAQGAIGKMAQSPAAVHVVWATGGSLVPEDEWSAYAEEGEKILARRDKRQ